MKANYYADPLKDRPLEIGQWRRLKKCYQHQYFHVTVFRPNKDKVVTLAHTFESIPFESDENMRLQEGTGRPDIADVYMNRFKGVDIHDQYCAFLEWPFRTNR